MINIRVSHKGEIFDFGFKRISPTISLDLGFEVRRSIH